MRKLLSIIALLPVPFALYSTPVQANPETCEHCGKSLSRAFIDVSKRVRPAIVHIRAEISSSYAGFEHHQPMNPFEQFQEELFNKFFGFPLPDKRNQKHKPQQIAAGSGFLVSPDGYIITNHHVIKDANRIIIERYETENDELEAQLVGCDPSTDLAVLKIAGENYPFLEFGDSDELEVGQWTLAFGHPFSLRDSVTAGVVSAVHRGNLQISQLEDFVQTDTTINPGNSGGPLVNLDSKVIGVNTAILSQSGGSIGLNFAIPSNIVVMVYEQIRKNGSVDRAFLGVYIQDLDDNLTEAFQLQKGAAGALIAEVMPDSAAEMGGLRSGDIVTMVNGVKVRNGKQLKTAIMKLSSGSTCRLLVLRDRKEVELDIVLGAQKKQVSSLGDDISKLGITVEQITPENAQKFHMKTEDKGLVITSIQRGSIAAFAGWSVGDIILSVNGHKMTSIEALKNVLEKAPPENKLVFLLKKDGKACFFGIEHPEKPNR